jgi:hypothetical protein
MADIVRFGGGGGLSVPEGFSRGEAKKLQLATNREIGDGILGTVRMGIKASQARDAVQYTGNLAQLARMVAGDDEYLGSRCGAIVDGFVQYSIAQLGGFR